MIQIQNLHKAFGANQVLQGINLNLDQPGITAILGPNGSGKTTLIKSILGMVLPDQGSILFGEEAIRKSWQYRDQIDYLPQIARFPENLKVKELLYMLKDLRQRPSNDEQLIERFGLQPYLSSKLGTLSGGTRQKVNLLLALMFDNPVLILDEPTSGLDPVAMIQLKELILEEKARGKIILITTHIINFVEEMSDRIVFLLDGQVHFQGTVASLKSSYGEADLERAIASILTGGNPKASSNGVPLHSKRLTLQEE